MFPPDGVEWIENTVGSGIRDGQSPHATQEAHELQIGKVLVEHWRDASKEDLAVLHLELCSHWQIDRVHQVLFLAVEISAQYSGFNLKKVQIKVK